MRRFGELSKMDAVSCLRHGDHGLENHVWRRSSFLSRGERPRIDEHQSVAVFDSAWHHPLGPFPEKTRSSLDRLAESGFDVTHLERDFLNLTAASADCGNEREKDTNVSSVHDSNPLNKFLGEQNKRTLQIVIAHPRAGPRGLD
jgi:hypothetical protein